MTASPVSIDDLVPSRASHETLAEGFWFTEGPVWVPEGRRGPAHLLFNDIPGQTRWRWDLDGRLSIVAKPTNNANGMTLDATGRLIICEHASSRVIRLEPDGSESVLASEYGGLELNSPNDVVVANDGSIWFTDPRYGRRAVHGIERPVVLPHCGLYRIADPDGECRLQLKDADMQTPNGLCFSPGGSVLYVNDTEAMRVYRYEVADGGELGPRQLFFDQGAPFDAELGFPDGMKCDEQGNLWVTGPGGIWVIRADGSLIGKISTPTVVGNFCFGGPDGRWLFICASDRLLRLRTQVRGAAS